MTTSRRDFLRHFSSMAAVAVTARGARWPFTPDDSGRYPQAGDPALRALASAALDAARSAGASYADVRFTLTRSEELLASGFSGFTFQDSEVGHVGVRALADGAWGFAASPVWDTDEVARLGREAAAQARLNARGGRRHVELGDAPPVVTGTWSTPVRRDPFTVSFAEKLETMRAFNEVPARLDVDATIQATLTVGHRRQQKTFASTSGSFVTQMLYFSRPSFVLQGGSPAASAERIGDLLQPSAGGWEVVADAALLDSIPAMVDDVMHMLEARPVMPGRYDVVCDAVATAQLLAQTIGVAAELDRALGFEANAGGTTWLAPPEAMLGSSLGAALLSVAADRSQPGGAATVRWDDEGVTPEPYALIRDGVLTDYHTTRELAPALASWYARTNRAPRSHGCAGSENALGFPLAAPPNLAMAPAATDASIDDLAREMTHGLVVCGVQGNLGFGPAITVDRQRLNGELNGNLVYEVRNGKRTGFVRNAQCLFRAPELWKSLSALGGRTTQRWCGIVGRKGQPAQEFRFSVAAVPALFRGVAVTDILRKA